VPPKIGVDFGFIYIPNSTWFHLIVSVSFLFCVSGFMYCIINGANLYGYSLSEVRDIVVSLVELNSFDSQFLLEAYTTFIFGGLLTLSFFAMYHLSSSDTLPQWKIILYRVLAYSSLVWVLVLIMILNAKCSDYVPGFLPSYVHKKRRFIQSTSQQ